MITESPRILTPILSGTSEVYANGWVERHAKSRYTRKQNDYLISLIRKGVRSILDVGCGSGSLVGQLSQLGYQATGLDIIPGNIGYAQSHYQGSFVCSRLEDMKGEFDLIVMSHVLEHIEQPALFLDTARRLLSNRGRVIIIVPNFKAYDPESLWRAATYNTIFDTNHRVVFSPITLSFTLASAGFKDIQVSSHTYGSRIIIGLIMNIGRRLLTGKSPTVEDKVIASPKVGTLLESFAEMIPEMIMSPFSRLSERDNCGTDLIAEAVI